MLFRLAGRVTISVALADKKHRKDIMNDLAATDTRAAKSQGNLPVFWARTGEPPAHNCVSVLRLADWIEKGRLVIGGPGGADGALRVLYSMASLMEPAGPWKQPVARFVAPMPTALSTQHVDLTFHVYLGRLAFELISFSATKDLFSAMEPVSVVVPTRKRPEYPPTFRSPHGEPEGAARFTLPGVMRMAEHNGYRSGWLHGDAGPLPAVLPPSPPLPSPAPRREDEQPAGLTVTMFPFQRQTLAWMSDQEAWDLNQLMWEERQWLEGDCFFVFPLGGECRVHAPPRVTGGLLSEEMGLGKTLEVVALVLADKAKGYPEPKGGLGRGGGGARGPSRGRRGRGKEQGVAAAEVEHSDAEDDEADLRGARATLVVCPTTLIGQWDAEIAKVGSQRWLMPSTSQRRWSRNAAHDAPSPAADDPRHPEGHDVSPGRGEREREAQGDRFWQGRRQARGVDGARGRGSDDLRGTGARRDAAGLPSAARGRVAAGGSGRVPGDPELHDGTGAALRKHAIGAPVDG